MPHRVAQLCPQREAAEALARDELRGDDRRRLQRHLETCEPCRQAFRKLTADFFPALRNYTILERVGEGGFGVVYKAIHHDKQRTEAVKVLFGKTAIRAAYFENEVHLIANLKHPNIATLYETHIKTPPLYYTMEFVEGRQLNEYLREKQPALAERIGLVRTVAEAIGHAHAQGVVHRDIKPQNILVDAAGAPHIVDFGIARRLGLEDAAEDDAHGPARTSPEGVVGTLGFIAPEQAAGESVDARADLYALGVLLAQCITGEPARFASQPNRLARLLRARRVSRADDLAAIVARCLKPLAEDRYPTCAALVEDIDNYLTGRPVRAREHSSPGYRLARVATFVLRNHPYTAQGAWIACAAALFCGLFWGLDARQTAPSGGGVETVLIGFTEKTAQALRDKRIGADLPGLDPDQPKSRRLLHARLLERLKPAGPRVVVWDYFFKDCQPEYDDALARAMRELGAPVVVGAREFDVNGEPRLCPHIRAAAWGAGAMVSTPPGLLSSEYFVPLCIERGLAPPIPSLAVAALAAARFADAAPELRLADAARTLQLRYRQNNVPADAPRWRRETDVIRVTEVREPVRRTVWLQAGDRVAYGRVPAARWAARMVPYEDVLIADEKQLRAWFAGRAVVVGQMLTGEDQHDAADGRPIFGCEVQTQAVAALLTQAYPHPLSRWSLAARVGLWCLLGWAAARLLPMNHTSTLWRTLAGCGVLGAGGLVLASYAAWFVTDPLPLEILLGVSVFLTAGGGAFAVRTLCERQTRLAPETAWTPRDASLATTILAPPRSGGI